MAGFCTDPVYENNDVCSINKNRQLWKGVAPGMYIHIEHYETWKKDCLTTG